MSEIQEAPKSKQQILEEKFEKQRRDYSNEILTASQMLNDIKKLIQAKIIFLGLRQRLLEDHHVIIANYDKQAKKYREAKAEELMNTTNNMQVRFNEREKDKYVDGQPRISGIKMTMDFLQNQSSFLDESKKTVDHALYNIKVIVDMQRLMMGE